MANRNFRNDTKAAGVGRVLYDGTISLSAQALTGTTACTIPFASASMSNATPGLYGVFFQDRFVDSIVSLQVESTGSQGVRAEVYQRYNLTGSTAQSNSGSLATNFGASANHDGHVVTFRTLSGSVVLRPSNDIVVHFLASMKNTSL